jgi:hypothetical protein
MAIARYPFRTIALAPFLLIAELTGPAIAQQRVGVDSAVNPAATGTTPGAVPRRLVLGQEVVFNERITTGATGQTQILFVDETSMTLGPNGDMVIDEFVYDPNAGTGKLAASLSRGVFRFVGGKLSKLDNAVTMRTPSAIIGVRGGVMLVNLLPSGRLEVIFGYGKGLTVTGLNGVSKTITRPGFEVTVSGPGASPSEPAPAPADATEALLAQLDGRSDGNGGARTIPTETMVANSGIANIISSNIAASRRAAAQTRPPPAQPPNASTAVQQSEWNVQNVAYQGATVTPVSGGSPVPLINFYKNQTLSGTPVSATGVGGARVVATYAGLVKTTSDPTVGFTDQTGSSRIPYTNGILTFPIGSPQNGIFSASLGSLGNVSFPLVPGAASLGPANTSSPVGPLTGTSFLSPDNAFFYANLQAPAFPGDRGFIFGGQPVNQSFYAPTPTPRFLSFQVQPDGTFASGAQQQTIPFLSPSFGGTMPNATVSPLYVVTLANEQFGDLNVLSNPYGQAPKWLQASLAVNGQGASQTAALVVGNGFFNTSSDNGQVVAGGVIRGTVSQNAASPVVQIFASAHSVPDGNGNSLFGRNTLSGFVLDQNDNNLTGNFVPNLVSAAQFGTTTANYAFNQPVTSTAMFTPGARSALNETGFFGGVMSHTTNPTSGSPYILTGGTVVQTDPVASRVAATFTGTDPFTSGQSGISSAVLQFGSLPTSGGRNYSRSTFVDNNTYAALESPLTPSQINGRNLPTLTTVANPNVNAPGSAPVGSGLPNLTPSLAMVTSATVPANWMPAGVTPCSCQYLQWGYWTGQVLTPNATLTAVTRDDRAYINTWVAGMPTVTMPTSGVGTFNGAAVGTVFNNGATYLAAGNFNQNYNFGSLTGTVRLTNFDGANYSAAVSGFGNRFSGILTGTSNRIGNVAGSFFGPLAVETGGNFNIQSASGLRYLASGIFAGR